MCCILWQLCEPFNAGEVVEHVDRALKHHEVNWKSLLSLTAVTLVTHQDARQHVESKSFYFVSVFIMLCCFFLRLKAATALVCLSHRNSVCLSICHTGGSVINGAS